MQHATTTATTLITLLSAALSACGGDGGTLDRSTDAAADSGNGGRLVITSGGNGGDIVQLAVDGGADAGPIVDQLDAAAVPDAGPLDSGRADSGNRDACSVADGCGLCFGQLINCCRPSGACGCRFATDTDCTR